MIEPIVIKTFQEYIEKVMNLDLRTRVNSKVALFRGQENAEWDLMPKIGRLQQKYNDIDEKEKLLMLEFRRRSHGLLPKSFQTENEWNWLALAQHHGLPTRLLDWTENPLIALFFAFRRPINKNIEERAVWRFIAPSSDIVETNIESPYKLKKTKIFVPNQVTQRITAQSGWFTIHRYNTPPKGFLALNNIKEYKDKVRKYVFTNDLRIEFLNILDRLGVNSYTAFADLDGLSSYLNWKILK